ncbi:ParB/RepB/Spo0J family partition protein [Streptomyces sp. NPDC050504]|uniref:ParB/RepB/Spo0J family partition protein n=1 Tax=Streptomyces sp. NPDC050504 TaxID=3365618 RepID=UPI0037B87FE4
MSRVGDRLGAGSFGSSPARPGGRSARGRAKAVAQGDVPAYELVRIPLDLVSPTPINPRRNFGTEEEKERFGEELRQAQLAACVVVTRSAYLNLWPEHEAELGAADYVLVNGERRYRSATHVGLDALDFVVRDDLASSREEFVDHLLKENLEREDFDVIERARGVLELVQVCAEESGAGAKARASKRLGRDRSWVTNQLALLDLPYEIQTMLSAGTMPERDGRRLARHSKENPALGAAGLLAHLQQFKDQEARTKAEQRAILQSVKEARSAEAVAEVLSADNTSGVGAAGVLTSTAGAVEASGPAAPPADPVRPAASAVPTATPATAPATAPSAPAKASAAASAAAPAKASAAASAAAPAASPSAALLSADNTSELRKPAKAPSEASVGANVPHQAAEPNPAPGAQALVQKLGSTPAEQARTLAAGLSRSDLHALVTELRTYA